MLTMKVEGLDRLHRKLETMRRQGLPATERALEFETIRVTEIIRAAAPVGTESTARQINGEVRDYGRITTELKAVKVTKYLHGISFGSAFWSMFVEFGTVNMPAQPFIRPVVSAELPQVLVRFRGSLRADLSLLKGL